MAVGDEAGKVNADGSGAAADVKDGHAGLEVGEEVCGRVGDCAPFVGLEDGAGVVSGINGGLLSHFVGILDGSLRDIIGIDVRGLRKVLRRGSWPWLLCRP